MPNKQIQLTQKSALLIKSFGEKEVQVPNGSLTLQVTWTGPYAWPGFETLSGLQPVPEAPGLYLQTFEYGDGYAVYCAGLTRRPVPTRFKEHTNKYMNGEYTVLDVTAVQQGIRKEVWHGWGYAKQHRDEFEERKTVILDAIRRQLEGFRIFVGDVGEEPRMLERLEASIMDSLYQQPPPLCDIPDRGMQLSPRWDSEEPIVVESNCAETIHGLPSSLEI